MDRLRPLEEYAPFVSERALNLEALARLHQTVGRYRDKFLTDHALQDALLNRGYAVERRPTAFIDLIDTVVPRTHALIHQAVVNEMVRLATTPALIAAQPVPLWTPDNPLPKQQWTTIYGGDAACLEEFQQQWFREPTVSNNVLNYQARLENAAGEFNLKFMLTRMMHADAAVQDQWEDVARYQKEMKSVLSPEGYTALDNAYYNMGRRSFSSAGPLWELLQRSAFGKKFTLSAEEEQTELKRIMQRRAA